MKPLYLLRFLIFLILITVALIRLLPHFSDFSKLSQLWGNLRPVFLIAGLVSQVGQYIGDGLLSQILLKMIKFKISLRDTVKIASLNVFAAHLLPVGEAGALAATFYFYRKLGVAPEGIIFLSLTWGTITNAVLILFFLFSLFFLPKNLLPFHPTFGGLVIVLLMLLLVIIVIIKKDLIFNLFKKFLAKFAWSEYFFNFFDNFSNYKQQILSQPNLVFKAVIAAAIYYLSNVATFSLCFLALGASPNLPLITFAYTTSLVFGWITLAPAGIGATEATLLLIFLTAGMTPAIAVSTILLFRLITFWLPIPAGLFSYLSLKKEINKVKSF